MEPPIACSVISLPGSSRRPHVAGHLGQHGVDFEFFDAVDGRELPSEFRGFLSYWTQNNITRKRLLPGEVGVFASHYSLWQETAKSGCSRVIVEDDVYLTEHARSVLDSLPALLHQFGFIRLHRTVHGESPAGCVNGLSVARCHCAKDAALAYALTATAARRLVSYAQKWPEPVDHYISSSYLHGVDIYVVNPNAAEIREQFDSSIQPTRRTQVPFWMKPAVKPIHFLNKQRLNYHLHRQRSKIIQSSSD